MENAHPDTITVWSDDTNPQDKPMKLKSPKHTTQGPWKVQASERPMESIVRVRAPSPSPGEPDLIVAVVPVNMHDAERIALVPEMVQLIREVSDSGDFKTARQAKVLLAKLTNPEA